MTKTHALKALVISGYARGLSTRDVEASLAETLGPEAALSRSTVSRVCEAIAAEFAAWRTRSLAEVDPAYLYLDGSMFRYHQGSRAEPVLCAWAITTDGKPILLALDGARSQARSQKPTSRRSRQTTGRSSTTSPRSRGGRAHRGAPPGRGLCGYLEPPLPRAVTCVVDDLAELTVHLRFPPEHWSRIRHTNLIERTFGETRRRVKVIGRLPSLSKASSSASPAYAPATPST